MNVSIQGFAFHPDSVTVNAGDTVVWTMMDAGTAHTVTSDSPDTTLNSPLLMTTGPATYSHTFNAPGTFNYHCSPHPFMHGAVLVQSVANTPPSVTVTNPANGTSFSAPATFAVQADASDSDGTVMNVEFFVNNTSVGSDPTAPFGVTANNLPAGNYTLTARATDNGGLITTSAAVNVTVTAANQPPTVAITDPANGATFTADATITIQAAANDTDGSVTQVEFFDGTNSLGVIATFPYQMTITFYPGSHPLTAVATDDQGASTTSAEVTITVNSVLIAEPIPESIPKGDQVIEFQTVVDGLAAPLGMAVPDDGSGRLLVYDQAGQIWVVSNAGKLDAPMLDVHTRLVTQGVYDERGLLGVAVHPDFADNPLVYTYTSEPTAGPADFPTVMPEGATNNHQSVIAEWHIDAANSNQIDVASRREILRIDEPQSNHNAGAMHFGPDGLLYITLGDGGQANDVADGHVPGGNAQDINRILGKVIRLDIDGRNSANAQYGIPADNPFVGGDGLDEIYAYGLRNPFSFTFDRLTGALYLADAGQNNIEEVDVIVKGGNYGWNVKEGSFWFDSVGGRSEFRPSRDPARAPGAAGLD